jgi:signal transduction histidine kinase
MKKAYNALFVLALVVVGALSSAPAAAERFMPSDANTLTREEQSRLRAGLEAELTAATSARDSLKIYYNLFDLGPRYRTKQLVFPIYDLAVCMGDEEAELDMLRHCANLYQDSTAVMDHCLALARAKAASGDALAKETLLFVKIMYTVCNIGHGVTIDAPIEEYLNNLIARYISNPPTDPYEKFEVIFTLCAYMGNLGEGPALENYTEKLQEAMDELPLTTGAVRNAVYSRNAVSFTNFGLFRQALDSDRSLLRIIDSMEVQYARQGRIYRNYDTSRYNIYRRMLANSAGLRRPEVERLWNEIQEIASRNGDVEYDLRTDRRAEIYYLMATEQYEKAVPMILNRVLNNSRPLPYREMIYNDLITAAERIGDKDVLLKAYRVYSDMLRRRLANRQAESIRELAVAYSVRDFKDETEAMKRELVDRQLMTTRIVGMCAIFFVLLLGGAAFVLWRQKRRAAASAATIERINASLVEERDNLRKVKAELITARDEAKSSDKLKTDFINNMSHEIRTPLNAIAECSQLIVDCIPEDKKPFLDKFGRIVELNVALMQRLVNDVLDAASLESSQLSVAKMAVPVLDICNFAVSNTIDNLAPGVKFVFEPGEELAHTLMVTDKQRVSQVLMNLLNNAAKFTEKGSVTLSVTPDKDANTITFAVTDTGIGIRKGKEEVIFERFRQLDMSVRGCGLGLYISRLIARLMGGDVRVDTAYRGGARFVFILPLVE